MLPRRVIRKSERVQEPINGVSPDRIEERIKANLEPLNEQMSTLTQLLNQLFQGNSARNSPAANTHTQQTQSRLSPSKEARTSTTLPENAIGGTGFPLHKYTCARDVKVPWPFMYLLWFHPIFSQFTCSVYCTAWISRHEDQWNYGFLLWKIWTCNIIRYKQNYWNLLFKSEWCLQ